MDHNLLDINDAKRLASDLITGWSLVEAQTTKCRDMRYFKVDVSGKRESGEIQPDETYIPCRIIDTNIRKEQPKFVLYLTQSRRAAVLKSKDNVDNTELETLFTDVARYRGWELPILRTIDGAQCQGWDILEVVFDINYPGHFCFEHVGHDDLIFATDCEDIQDQEMLLRRCRLTKVKFQEKASIEGFNQEMVDQLIAKYPQVGDKQIVFDIYKMYFRQDKVVYVAWYSDTLSDWIKAPQQFYNGRLVSSINEMGMREWVDAPEDKYPFYVFAYTEGEEPTIISRKGRAYLDEWDQEGATAILSGYVNGLIRASNVYASPNSTVPTDGGPITPLKDVELKNGAIYSSPLNFFSIPYPPESAVRAFQTILTKNSGETSNVDYAVQNRQDSRKTATEVASAEQKSSELGSVQITLLSIFTRDIYTAAFQIWQSRVAAGRIPVEPKYIHFFIDETLQLKEYNILSSGDIDVVKRQEKLAKKMQFWPVIAATPLASAFLEGIIRDAFPDEAEAYVQILRSMNAQQQTIQKLAKVTQVLATDPQTGQLTDEAKPFENELQQLAIEVQQQLGSQQPTA